MFEKEELKPIDTSKYIITETGQVLKMTKDEMKDKISMALKDPILQQEFEVICKNLAELDCQMNRNKYCYSCANVTDRCFRNEIGCPCAKYKSYKDENAELKSKNCWKTCEYAEPKSQWISQHIQDVVQLTKAKKIIRNCLNLWNNVMTEETVRALIKEAEQFIKEECKNDRIN